MSNTTIDIIILSYAYNDKTTTLTKQTIQTLISSESPDNFVFNIIVLESNQKLEPYQYADSVTIYPNQPFNFNKFLNIGIRKTSNNYICLCNNDLYFHKNWATNLIFAMNQKDALCASTYWEQYHNGERGIAPNTGLISGYREIFSGWCFVVKRSLLDKIGQFDEKINFWYSDDDFCNTLKKHGVENYLVTNAPVTHVGGYSLDNIPEKRRKELTTLPMLYYQYKWHHNLKLKYYILLGWHKLKISIWK